MSSGGLPSVSQGRSAERQAARWLRRRGYRILALNYRIRGAELDLVARRGEMLCFVEVKARGDGSWFDALEAIHPQQLRRIVRAAESYLLAYPHDGPMRFDIMTIEQGSGHQRIRHLPDAFSLDDVPREWR